MYVLRRHNRTSTSAQAIFLWAWYVAAYVFNSFTSSVPTRVNIFGWAMIYPSVSWDNDILGYRNV